MSPAHFTTIRCGNVRSVQGRPTSAFTIIEMLVAVAVLTVLVVILAGTLSQTSSLWRKGQAQIARYQAVSAIFELISQDLRSALLPMRMGDQDGLQFIANSSALPNELTNPHTLFWQVAVGRKGSGGVAIVGYFVRWDTTDNVNPTARLCRAFVEELDAPATANPLFKVYETPANWLDGAFVNEAAPADAVNYYRGFLAENIVGIWFRFFDSAGDPIGIPSDMMDSRIGYTETGSGANRQVPFSVEVSIAITDRQAATQITSVSEITSQYGKLYESGSLNPRSFLDALPKPIAAGTYVYTVRVEIPIAR